ncbi:putative ribosomal protein L15 [Neorickettsia helminthoeca str. Oregon]|uniref:Putative ribosomal protein L15 n=1 Tax=Neorickettsia helminthoeca str. Oregon TaxID=1286528 RepID=X5GVX3_9RICK|nr:putative ribosomal protein L15 [Neorickettsia helminthoeca str. Oregon]
MNKKIYSIVSAERIASLVQSDLFDSGERHLSKEMMLKCGLVREGFPVKILASHNVSLAELGLLSCEYDKASSAAKRSFGFVQ